jgi:hypothetical protein
MREISCLSQTFLSFGHLSCPHVTLQPFACLLLRHNMALILHSPSFICFLLFGFFVPVDTDSQGSADITRLPSHYAQESQRLLSTTERSLYHPHSYQSYASSNLPTAQSPPAPPQPHYPPSQPHNSKPPPLSALPSPSNSPTTLPTRQTRHHGNINLHCAPRRPLIRHHHLINKNHALGPHSSDSIAQNRNTFHIRIVVQHVTQIVSARVSDGPRGPEAEGHELYVVHGGSCASTGFWSWSMMRPGRCRKRSFRVAHLVAYVAADVDDQGCRPGEGCAEV